MFFVVGIRAEQAVNELRVSMKISEQWMTHTQRGYSWLKVGGMFCKRISLWGQAMRK